MPAPNKIYIQIDIDSKEGEKAVDDVNKKIKDIGETADKASEKASGGIKRISTTVEQSASSMDKLAQAISGLGLAEVGRQFLTMGDDLNRIRMGFENLAGGSIVFRQLKQLSLETGMSLRDLAGAAQDLRSAGTAPELIASRLRILADQAAFAGKNIQVVMNATEKLRAIAGKNFLSTEDLGTLTQMGVRVDDLTKKFGKTRQEMMRMWPQMNPEAVERALFETMQKTSAGMAAKVKGQLPGATFGELQNKVQILAQELEQSLAPALIAAMKPFGDMLDLVGEAARAFDKLPEPVKKTAVALGVLAVSAKAVSTAFSLWSMLPGVSGWLMKLGGGIAGLSTSMVNLVAGTGAVTTVFTATEVAAGGLMAALSPLLPLILALSAAAAGISFAAFQYFSAPDPDEVAQMKKAFADRDALVKEAIAMEEKLRKISIKPPERTQSFQSMQIDDLRTSIALMDELKKKHDALLEANEEAVKRATEYGAKVQADAMRDYLKVGQETIAALTYAWKEHWKNTELSAKGTSDALIGHIIAVATETKRQLETVKEAQNKAAAESATMTRKLAIAELEGVPGIGGVGQYQIAALAYEHRVAELTQQARIELRKGDEATRKQIEGVRSGGVADLLKAGTPKEAILVLTESAKRVEELQRANSQAREIQEMKVIQGTEEARIEMEKRINAATYQMEKDQRDAQTQAEIEQINQIRDYTLATTTLVEAQTKQQKLAQIDATLQANLAAIDKVGAAQERNIYAARDQFQRALDLSKFTDEEKKAQLESYDALVRDPALKAIQRQANHEMQMQRVESWRAGNQVIIEEQKQVFESIAGVMGELFDAFLDKNKSVWSAIGDTIKRTILGALKSIVTSRLAASFAGMLGYGNVTFTQGPLGQQIPVFSGGGTPPFVPASTATGASSNVNYGANRSSVMSNVTDVLVNELRNAPGKPTIPTAASVSMGGSTGSADRMMDDSGPVSDVSYATGAGGATGGFGGRFNTQAIRESFGIGQPVMATRDGITKMIPWSQATRAERLRGMLKSPGFAAMASSVGTPMFMDSLRKRGVLAGLEGIAGGALAGYGLAMMFGSSWMGPSGALAGAGIGLFAAGYKRRGVSGLAMTTLGGTLAGAGIGNMIMPGVGAVVGAAVGAAVGLGVGIVNLFRKSSDQQVRELIRQTYGVDISDKGILAGIVEIAKQRYGGDVRLAVHSQEVMEMVRTYSLMTAQNANLPRPMYPATFAQSAAGGVQLQPVYSGGRLVSSPYTGTTTTQVANALQGPNPVFLQLNPQQATSLFSGQVVQVMGNNPGAVGAAATTAARSGQGRTSASSALLEPTTVLA